ncbi:MAG: alcohol dehydrogenase catalytic domain-containing protein [Proteobacteria bacterium]|nr:alcohol dehydrogenase catalytic domain-containing protein [Pseudomonadota bacterium]
MKALVYTGPETVEFRDAAEPIAGVGEAILEVAAVGICGSDMHAYHGHDDRRPAPLILGHEAVGRVVEGRDKGRLVAVNPLVTCGQCDVCLSGRSNLCAKRQIISMPPRQGAFAERLAMPEGNLVALPDGMDPLQAALTEPLATSYHAAHLAARAFGRPLAGAKALVIGAGSIGIGAALALRMQGCTEIMLGETNPLRRRTAERTEAANVYDPISEPGPAANSLDIVIDAVGMDATRAVSFKAVRPGGVIVHIGLAGGSGGMDIRKATLQEVTFIGTYTYSMTDFRETLAAIHRGNFGTLDWFEERPLSEGAAAFQDLAAGRSAAAKIILRP